MTRLDPWCPYAINVHWHGKKCVAPRVRAKLDRLPSDRHEEAIEHCKNLNDLNEVGEYLDRLRAEGADMEYIGDIMKWLPVN